MCSVLQSNETGWTAIKGSVSGKTLTITAQDNSCTDTISWMVVGERNDTHMKKADWTDADGRVIVEPTRDAPPKEETPREGRLVMPYIGKSPSAGVRQRYQYTATAGQTTFSGTDLGNLTLTYTDNNFVDVFQNGVLLKGGGTDYTATSGTSVVLATGASVSDVIEIIVYDVFSVGNFYNRTDSDSRYVNVDGDTMTGALTNNAGIVVDNITIDGQEIDVSSGDLTLDVAGNIILDADSTDILLKDGGTTYGQFFKDSNDFKIVAGIQDGDIVFRGNDGGSGVDAMRIDFSEVAMFLLAQLMVAYKLVVLPCHQMEMSI